MLCKCNSVFPEYNDFNPEVPVWCVTPGMKGCIHRFFDTSPISPSGRYLAVFQLPFEDRQPEPGEKGSVYVIDLETGKQNLIAETAGWEPQLGANINWGGTDNELYFNDVDKSTWKPFAWKADCIRGRLTRMSGPVYHVSGDGKLLVSSNMAAMRRTQPGYGVVIPEEHIRRNIGPADDDGFYVTDSATGRTKLVASIKYLLENADPPVLIDSPEDQEIYGFHCKFNPQGSRLMLSLRWFPAAEPVLNMFQKNFTAVRYAWLTLSLSDGTVSCAVGPEQWKKGGHHATWFPEGDRISMNLNIDEDEMRFVRVNHDGSCLEKISDVFTGSGHPTVYPGGRYILTDAYLHEGIAFDDGTVPIRWVDLEEGTDRTVIRVNVKQPAADAVLRVDPHPAWDRSWRYIVFNGFHGGTRKVFIADMRRLIG